MEGIWRETGFLLTFPTHWVGPYSRLGVQSKKSSIPLLIVCVLFCIIIVEASCKFCLIRGSWNVHHKVKQFAHAFHLPVKKLSPGYIILQVYQV